MRKPNSKFEKVVTKFVQRIEERYLKLYPLDSLINKHIEEETDFPSERLKEINKIRTNNIITTIWAKTGTILGIIITMVSFLLTLMLALYIPFSFSEKLLYKLLFFVTFFLVIYIIYRILLNAIPFLVKKIVYHLPSEEYSDLSMNSLNQSEILTFVALKMYTLCEVFDKTIVIHEYLGQLSEIKEPGDFNEFCRKYKTELKCEVKKFKEDVVEYNANYIKELNNIISLVALASKKLNIKERELLNHILKFSPHIFRRRVESLRNAISTIDYVLQSKSTNNSHFQSAVKNNLSEIIRIKTGVKNNSMRSLKQIILYNDTHNYLIGMSSIVSTSRSLKIFCEGLGYCLKPRLEGFKSPNSKVIVDVQVEKFKTILHRSKAHYGMDLLVLLENFCKSRFRVDDTSYRIPEGLFSIKYPKRVKKRNLTGLFSDIDDVQIITSLQSEIFELRDQLLLGYIPAIEGIKSVFKKELDDLKSDDGKIFFCLFGYSRIVRNVLKSFALEIYQRNIATFVVKDDSDNMIDTQIYRFELNDDKPNFNLRRTFTAGDHFFESLVNEGDTVIFLGGAEAYDSTNYKLLHTNNYQVRVNNIIKNISSKKRLKLEVWILAGEYKVFKNFPNRNSFFEYEFYSDHYDFIDFYDFKFIKDNVKLITTTINK